MKKIAFFSLVSLVFLSCSSYRVSTELKKGDVLSKFKHTGIIYRVLNDNVIQYADCQKNLQYWLATYEKMNNLEIVSGDLDDLSIVQSENESLYQLSPENSFVKYKSIGVATTYLHDNSEKLNKIMAEKGFDSLLFYNIDGGFSVEMQFMDFNSVVLMVDSGLNISYLDYQKSYFEINEMSPDIIKKHLMDKLSDRLVRLLEGLDYIKRK